VADIRVTCINKPDRNSPHEHITHLGGPGGGGWKLARERVIANIEGNLDTFHVIDAAGHRSGVAVVNPGNGRAKYLRTHADGDWNNNLLALPECR
jgi:hypothetical protein